MNADNIEDIYPLSGMQQALLFHGLHAGKSDKGILHLRCTLAGQLDVAVFQAAWRRVVARCPVLRSGFVWEGIPEPLQIVHRQVELPWQVVDLAELAGEQRAARMEALLRDDLARGLDLQAVPLMRMLLIRLSAERHEFQWCHHHLEIDGWSLPNVLHDVFASYTAISDGREPALPERRPYRDYIAWLQHQDLARAEEFWRRTLKGFSAATSLAGIHHPDEVAAEPAGMAALTLPAAVLAGLQQLAKSGRLTLNVAVRAAWALLLNRCSGERDVVFGATVSGRPAELIGAEAMIGSFINNLPVRAVIRPEQPILALLHDLMAQQAEAQEFEFVPLAQLQKWSEIPAHQRLFDSLLIFQNFPDQPRSDGAIAMTSDGSAGDLTSNFPLTVVVELDAKLAVRLIYDRARFDLTTAKQLLGDLAAILGELSRDASVSVAELARTITVRPRASENGSSPPGATSPYALDNGSAALRKDSPEYVPAAHPLHQELIQIWEELLGVKPIGINDNFFDLGGHSLLAMRMMDRIEQLCGRRVHLAALFQGGTIAQLTADLMRDDHQQPTFAQLILHRKGLGRSFIFVSGFLDLGRHLGPDHPFLGIDVPIEDKRRDPKTTFQDLADQCIAQVREFQPEGPYCLGGHCFGAVIAFEMAQKLVAQGQRVDLLALMEPSIPLSMSSRPGIDRYLFHLRKLFELNPAHQTLYLWNKVKILANRFFSGFSRRALGLAENSIDLDASFQPKPYPGKITVIFGQDTYLRLRPDKDPRLCWAQWALGGFETFDVPGDHVTFCREPQVRTLGQRLRECIERISVAKPGPPTDDGHRAATGLPARPATAADIT